MNWLRNKLRVWLGVERDLESIKYIEQSMHSLESVIKERTEYHLDVHQYEGSQVIIIGKYGKRDFVKCYSIDDKDVNELRDHCKYLENYARKGKVDAWPTISFFI